MAGASSQAQNESGAKPEMKGKRQWDSYTGGKPQEDEPEVPEDIRAPMRLTGLCHTFMVQNHETGTSGPGRRRNVSSSRVQGTTQIFKMHFS